MMTKRSGDADGTRRRTTGGIRQRGTAELSGVDRTASVNSSRWCNYNDNETYRSKQSQEPIAHTATSEEPELLMGEQNVLIFVHHQTREQNNNSNEL